MQHGDISPTPLQNGEIDRDARRKWWIERCYLDDSTLSGAIRGLTFNMSNIAAKEYMTHTMSRNSLSVVDYVVARRLVGKSAGLYEALHCLYNNRKSDSKRER